MSTATLPGPAVIFCPLWPIWHYLDGVLILTGKSRPKTRLPVRQFLVRPRFRTVFPGWSVGHEVFSIDISIPENCKPLPFDWNGRFRPAYDIQHDRDEFQRIQARENYVQCFLPALYSGKSFAVRCMDNKFVEMPSTIWRPIATLKEWEDDITLEIRDAGYSVKGTGAMHHYIVNASEEGMEATSRQ